MSGSTRWVVEWRYEGDDEDDWKHLQGRRGEPFNQGAAESVAGFAAKESSHMRFRVVAEPIADA